MARNALMMKDKVKLIAWITANWERFEGQTDKEFAAAAAEGTGIECLTVHHVNYILLAMEIVRRKGPEVRGLGNGELATIVGAIRQMQQALDIVPTAGFAALVTKLSGGVG